MQLNPRRPAGHGNRTASSARRMASKEWPSARNRRISPAYWGDAGVRVSTSTVRREARHPPTQREPRDADDAMAHEARPADTSTSSATPSFPLLDAAPVKLDAAASTQHKVFAKRVPAGWPRRVSGALVQWLQSGRSG